MKREIFVSIALKYLGYPAIRYKNANIGNTVLGFDCSGYVSFLLNEAGYSKFVPRHCNEFFDTFGIFIHDQFREAGDLIFFSHRSKGIYPDHMGILVSQNEFIHSPGKDKRIICVDKIKQKLIAPNEKVTQIYYTNPIGIKRITVKKGRYQKTFLT